MTNQDEEAQIIAEAMRAYAIPDSRFDLDFSRFIPGFGESHFAAKALRATPAYQSAAALFCTLEASLWDVRQFALEDGKDVIMPSYGLRRGVFHLRAREVAPEHRAFATCLDGLELFGEPVSPEARFDFQSPENNLFVCGASAIAKNGVRFGVGAIYIDVEWWIGKGLRLITDQSPVYAIIHDAQLSPAPRPAAPRELTCDAVFTPTQSLTMPSAPRPKSPPDLAYTLPDWRTIPIVEKFFRI